MRGINLHNEGSSKNDAQFNNKNDILTMKIEFNQKLHSFAYFHSQVSIFNKTF